MAGMSYYNQIPDAYRDQERSENSVVVFNQLVEKFPKSEYVNDAKFKIQVAKDQIAAREKGTGVYFDTIPPGDPSALIGENTNGFTFGISATGKHPVSMGGD